MPDEADIEFDRLIDLITDNEDRLTEFKVSGDSPLVQFAWNDSHAALLDAVRSLVNRNHDLRRACTSVMECPWVVDEATVPAAGMDSAPLQVVGTLHMSLARRREIMALLKK